MRVLWELEGPGGRRAGREPVLPLELGDLSLWALLGLSFPMGWGQVFSACLLETAKRRSVTPSGGRGRGHGLVPGTEDWLLSLPPVLWGSLLPYIQLLLRQLCF